VTSLPARRLASLPANGCGSDDLDADLSAAAADFESRLLWTFCFSGLEENQLFQFSY
jgi:hypothetical protein